MPDPSLCFSAGRENAGLVKRNVRTRVLVATCIDTDEIFRGRLPAAKSINIQKSSLRLTNARSFGLSPRRQDLTIIRFLQMKSFDLKTGIARTD